MGSKAYDLTEAAARIRAWQREQGFSGREIAKAAEISPAYYSEIANGKRRGSIVVLQKISSFLGHSLDELSRKAEDPAKSSGLVGKHLKGIPAHKIRRKMRPVLRDHTDDFMECYEVWLHAPESVKRALKAYQQGEQQEESRRRA